MVIPLINQTQYQKRFKCELCDFSFFNERNLNYHITRKHTKINQLDGNVSLMVPAEEQDWKDVKRKKKKKNNKSEPAVRVNELVPQTTGNSDVKNFQNNSIILHQQTRQAIAPVFEYDDGHPEYTEASNHTDDYTDDECW